MPDKPADKHAHPSPSVEGTPQFPGAGAAGGPEDVSGADLNPEFDLDGAAPGEAAAPSAPKARAAAVVPSSAANTTGLPLPSFDSDDALAGPFEAIELLQDVSLRVKIELGRSRMLVEDVLRLGEGSVVELDKLAGDPVDVYVNERLVARGEVLVLNDSFCVRVNEIISDATKDFQTA